jgi:DNA excision repair protein ERCC-4
LKHTSPSTITAPFTILVDGREKAPYRFTGLHSDSSTGRRELIVTTEWAHLKSGDYTIRGLESTIAVERKSLDDIFSTLGQNRERFEEEHRRLAEFRRAVVVIEASWWTITNLPPERSKLNPKTVFRTALSWHVRYGVPWIATEDRRLGEIYTYRFLEKCWKEFGKERKTHDQTEWTS